jgi:GAF domain-containing protein
MNYKKLLDQINALIDAECDNQGNIANILSFIYHKISELNWVGVYIRKKDVLHLNQFNGEVACTRIKLPNGVCGTAASSKTIQVVDDVHLFEGHIACDSKSNSELVIPLFKNNVVFGVLDIDSLIKYRFDDELVKFFIEVSKILEKLY